MLALLRTHSTPREARHASCRSTQTWWGKSNSPCKGSEMSHPSSTSQLWTFRSLQLTWELPLTITCLQSLQRISPRKRLLHQQFQGWNSWILNLRLHPNLPSPRAFRLRLPLSITQIINQGRSHQSYRRQAYPYLPIIKAQLNLEALQAKRESVIISFITKQDLLENSWNLSKERRNTRRSS